MPTGRHTSTAITGAAVANLGHAHPEIFEAIAEQATLLLHTSNMLGIPAISPPILIDGENKQLYHKKSRLLSRLSSFHGTT